MPERLELVQSALRDPHLYCARRGATALTETLPEWQARAVVLALDGATSSPVVSPEMVERGGAWLDQFVAETGAFKLEGRDVVADAEAFLEAALAQESPGGTT